MCEKFGSQKYFTQSRSVANTCIPRAYPHFSGCIKDNNGSMTEEYRDTVFTSDLETVALSLS